jgi:hypothetical protein
VKSLKYILMALFFAVMPASLADDTSSPGQVRHLAMEYNKRMNKMLSAGSTEADVDNLFALYADDFEYNHPGMGDVYVTQNLYNNSVRNVKAGRFDGSYQQKITNIIIGKNAAVLEWVVPGETETQMTFIETKGDQIWRIKEFW